MKTSFLSTGNSIFFYSDFFLLMETITEIWGKSNFKDETYSCQWTPIIFDFFRYFLILKPCFRIVKAYYSISFIRLVQTNFLPTETAFFLFTAILLLLEIISGSFFLRVETSISTKSFILTSGNGFSGQRKPFFLCSEVFRSSGNSH